MIKRTFIIIFFINAIVSTGYLFGMESGQMLEVIEPSGKRVLVPLAETIKEFAQPAHNIDNSGILQSTYDFMCAHPAGVLEAIGYTAFLGSLVYFMNSKKCFLTPWTYRNLENKKKAQIEAIQRRGNEILSAIGDEVKDYVIQELQKKKREAMDNLDAAIKGGEAINTNLNILENDIKRINREFGDEQKRYLQLLIEEFNKVHTNDADYFREKKQNAEEALQVMLDEHTLHSNTMRSLTVATVDDFSEEVDSYLDDTSRYQQNTASQLGLLQSNLEDTLQQLKKAQTDDDLDLKSLQDLSASIEKQKQLLEVLEEAYNPPIIVHISDYEN